MICLVYKIYMCILPGQKGEKGEPGVNGLDGIVEGEAYKPQHPDQGCYNSFIAGC